ncbi:FG-GAP repeat domain-containing protein, partial [Gordoniibacillus kamchatkensis]|uniref:FG-GAP repeat domain-containing protein n=1 Tax=Gordoniibacillus kamchatkensis TaxID=1590651 RepID=UPI0018CD4A6A
MRVSTFFSKRTLLYAVLLAAAVLTALFSLHRQETIRLLYATNGDSYDPSAYDQFRQSNVANLTVERRDWNGLSARQLGRYDAVYLDPGLHTAQGLAHAERLTEYVRKGGHLFLENVFAADVPLALLGAQQLEPVHSAAAKPAFTYPQVDADLRGMQQVFQMFSSNFFTHTSMDDLPGFAWGTGMKPSTALTLVALDGVSIATANAYGGGSVLLSSAFLPNRYFITGYDLQSGMDPAAGFPTLVKQFNEKAKPVRGAAYFDKTKLPLEPFFHFAFSAANAQYRTEYVSFVSKRKYGLTVKKVLGPYGRPAMAFQNHFEAMPAIRDRDGIQWAEMLKEYREIPSFSLVRSTYEWGLWKESVSAQLNTGTSAQPKFHGEAPNSFYGSGTHLFAISGGSAADEAIGGGSVAGGSASGGTAKASSGNGASSAGAAGQGVGAAASGSSAAPAAKIITGARYPDYKELANAIDLPYRASPAFMDVNGDGRADLLLGSADGSVSVYINLGPEPAASGTAEAVPAGVAPPDRFAGPQPLRLEDAGGTAAQGAGAAGTAVAGKAKATAGTAGVGAAKAGTVAASTAASDAQAGYRVPSYAALAVASAAGMPPTLLVGDGDGRVTALALGAGGRFASPVPVAAGGRRAGARAAAPA